MPHGLLLVESENADRGYNYILRPLTPALFKGHYVKALKHLVEVSVEVGNEHSGSGPRGQWGGRAQAEGRFYVSYPLMAASPVFGSSFLRGCGGG